MSFSGQVRVSTRDIGLMSRHHYWEKAVNQYVIHIDCPVSSGSPLEAELRHSHGDIINVNYIEANRHSVQRSRIDIDEDRRDGFFVCLMTKGNGYSYQGINCASHMPGDMVIYDTAKPYGHGFPENMGMYVLDVPRFIVERELGVVDGLIKVDRTLQCGTSSTSAIFKLLESNPVSHHAFQLKAEEVMHHIQVLSGLHGAKFNQKNRHLLFFKCKALIEQHLTSPDLNTEMISKQLSVSCRQIARAFAAHGMTMSRYVWQSRLHKSREDILNLDNLSITDIAYKWGFSHSSHFSRAYKQYFNESPQLTRQQKRQILV
ncbi:Transcriptional activator NphR [Marinomonas spartinae]|uniref:Transcriptional activator NphR n=1 Tax=Marinomonas spartinae TaxID=1792290 RepID=A0A1A8TJ15_9GAMM|nr:helix-turn-helix domain-containing protein [Marinomonas spartinae]SBS33717.1 Transcriptional activator NphR [Marinomonas spartinae]